MTSDTVISTGVSADPPADWRERVLRALSSEGVSEAPHMPLWRLYLIHFAKFLGWLLLASAVVYAPVAVALADPNISDKQGALFAALWWLTVTPVVLGKFVGPRFMETGRIFRSELYGRNPSHAVTTALRPPIFYLRSFAFDKTASTTPSYALTPEMLVTFQMRRYAPVIAIGRPGESHPPPGALRFHVTDEHWEAVVKQIVPCCQLVLWVTGNTTGLNWEIKQLVASLAPKRLLLWPNMNLEGANRYTINWKANAGQRNIEWCSFVDAHSGLFPKPLPRDITNVRFIAFDADWTPLPIPSHRYSEEFRDRLIDARGVTGGLRAFLRERVPTIGPK